MKPIRMVQMGMSHEHAPYKITAFKRFPEMFEIVGICEPDPAAYEKYSSLEAFQGVPVLTEDEVWSIPGLEAIAVETEVPHLQEYAQKCIDRNLHIHLDKPGGVVFEDYKKLLLQAEAKNLVVQMGYMYRYYPTVRYCFDMVKSGKLGKIFEIDAHMCTQHPQEYRQWMEQFPGGAMYIFGCHMIDLIVYMLGMPTNVIPINRNIMSNEMKTFDSNLAVLEYPDASCCVRINSIEINGFARREMVICGTDGTIEIKPFESPSTIRQTLRPEVDAIIRTDRNHEDCSVELPIPAADPEHRYDEQVKSFARIIRGEEKNPFSYQHDIDVHRVTMMACGVKI